MKNILLNNPIIISDSINNLSECCGAKPVGSLEVVHEVLTGVCADCKQWSDFNEEDDFIDWGDEVEYMREHI
jgi:hypothetical protein|tara:strand:- start:397 stop:612 length:216 start_codon:yes stop_codon:yes gene_type:complete